MSSGSMDKLTKGVYNVPPVTTKPSTVKYCCVKNTTRERRGQILIKQLTDCTSSGKEFLWFGAPTLSDDEGSMWAALQYPVLIVQREQWAPSSMIPISG